MITIRSSDIEATPAGNCSFGSVFVFLIEVLSSVSCWMPFSLSHTRRLPCLSTQKPDGWCNCPPPFSFSPNLQTLTGFFNSPSPLTYSPKLFIKFPVCTFNCCIRWLHSSFGRISSPLRTVTSIGLSNCPPFLSWQPIFSDKLSFLIKYQDTVTFFISYSNSAFTVYCNAGWTLEHLFLKVQLAYNI